MPAARQILRRRARRAERNAYPLTVLIAFFSVLVSCASVGLIVTGVGGAVAFSQIQPDLPDVEQLAERFLAQDSGQSARIVAQNSRGEWETIGTVEDPLPGQRVWRPAAEFPPQAAAAVRALAPDFPANQLRTQLDPPLQTSIPFVDQLTLENYESLLQSNYDTTDEDSWYLNTAYFGHLAFGLEAAAQRYFQKSVETLTLAEIALLTPIPLDPTLNPIDDFAGAKARQETTLESMVDQGMIDRQTFVTARFSAVTLNPLRPAGPTAEFVDLVLRDAEQLLGPEELVWGGHTIFTTLDLELQQQATCVAKAHLGRLSAAVGDGLGSDEALLCDALALLPELSRDQLSGSLTVNDAAIVMLDPRSGHILALATTAPGSQLAVAPTHQPGTAFTVFPVVTALSQGLSGGTMLFDVEQDFGTPFNGVAFVPQNDDGRFEGPLTLRDALAGDRIVPAVELLSRVGPTNAVRDARRLGISSLDPTPNRYGLSLVVGGGEVSVLEMAQAYAVLANLGTSTGIAMADQESDSPQAISKIEDEQGRPVVEVSAASREIVSPQIAYVVNDLLADQQSRCAALGCPNLLELPGGRPAAVKVGTTNDRRDGWTIGYTPQLVTAVWVGNRDQRPMGPVTGLNGATPIWQALMGYALADKPAELWSRPERLVERLICLPSGQLATDLCPTRVELFLSGTEPTALDTIYQEVDINRLNGRLATLDTPADLIETKTFAVYPPAAAEWAAANDLPQPPAEFDTIEVEVAQDDVVITSPQPFDAVSGEVDIRGSIDLQPGGSYRISYFAGLAPDLFYPIEEERSLTRGRDLLGRWDTGGLEGLYTIVVSVFRPDGTFSEVDLQVTVDQTPPLLTVIEPADPGRIETSASRVTITVDATDNLGLADVSFYEDGLLEPFAVRESPPFSADVILGGRCHGIKIVARDAAGNESETAVGPVCPAN